MDSGGLYDVVEKIFFGVKFLALGGILGAIFFIIFAPNVMGIKSISKQLEGLQKQLEKLNERLDKTKDEKDSGEKAEN